MSDPQSATIGATVEFFGGTFGLNPGEDYQWEMMEFANVAVGGADSETLAGAASVYRLLKAAIRAEDWDRFQSTARRNKAQVKEHLMPIVVMAFTQKTGHPSGPPSDSSTGRPLVPESSEVGSYAAVQDRVIAREEMAGRPDRAAMVALARDAQDPSPG